MEYLKSGWKTVVGEPVPTSNEQQNVAETVEKLVERVETSTLLEDRRDACRALRSLSKTYRLEVGAQAMDALVFVLQNDSSDNEIVTYAIEALNNVIGTDEEGIVPPSDLCSQFTEIFIKRKENVQLIIDLLPEFDFKIRWPTIKFLYGLLRNKLRECQDCILTHPMGISRMMDLLLDPREVIRNDALLLLVYLTKSNANIQKIVAFENAFDRILDIISSEGFSDGGVIVEDCLSILLNLLKMNTSNQNFFKEGSYIQKLLPFLDIPFDSTWNPQKINNLLLMLRVIRSLVSPSNPLQVTNACQRVMNQSGVLQNLCTILLSNGIPAEILTETINCVAEVIRGNQSNQDYFGRVNAPIEPPKPVIVILLMSMVNEKQPFELRCAVLYCFQSFLYKNDLGQAQIVETLLPTTAEVPVLSAGQLLCSGFFSNDSLSNWFVAVGLSYTLLGNVTQKEQLLRVQLATNSNSPPTSLLAYCSNLLQQGGHFQRRVSLLMLLSTWLANSSLAVSSFLSIPTNIPFLTSQVALVEGDDAELLVQGLCAVLLGICICYNDNSIASFTKDDLCKIITDRIGTEIYADKLSLISKNEKYSQALQKPQLTYSKPSDVTFDFEFCNFFRCYEGKILKIVQPSVNDASNGLESSLTSEDHRLLTQYKELIREQDEQLTLLRKQFFEVQSENEGLKVQLQELHSIVQQLRDQNALLKVQKSSNEASLYNSSQTYYANSDVIAPNGPSVTSGEHEQAEVNATSDEYAFNANSAENILHHTTLDNTNVHHLSDQVNSLTLCDNSAVNQPLAQYSSGEQANASVVYDANQFEYLVNENRRLLAIIDQYKYWEQNYYAYFQQPETLSTNVNVSDSDISSIAKTESDQKRYESPLPELNNTEVDKYKFELESLRKEQDELLMLLADQDLKMRCYVDKLKEHGIEHNETNLSGNPSSQVLSCAAQPTSYPPVANDSFTPHSAILLADNQF